MLISIKKDIDRLSGLCIVRYGTKSDKRGRYSEIYNNEDLEKAGITDNFVQENEIIIRKGVLRGFDVNLIRPQAKLLRVVKGSIADVVIDLRRESPTFLRFSLNRLEAGDKKLLYIPERFAHAYLAMEDTLLQIKVTEHFEPDEEYSFAWDSSPFDVNWPRTGELIMAAAHPEFSLDGFDKASAPKEEPEEVLSEAYTEKGKEPVLMQRQYSWT